MTHDDLVRRAVTWLRRPKTYRAPLKGFGLARVGGAEWYKPGCGVVVPELVTYAGEIPDAIGWTASGYSYAIECKATRADFNADRRKPRGQGQPSMGAERLYLCPAELILPTDLPDAWGLIWVHANAVSTQVAPRPNPNRDLHAELGAMYSLLRRVEVRGLLTDCLAPKWGGSGDPREASA